MRIGCMALVAGLSLAASTYHLEGQEAPKRIMAQDPSLNNLVDPKGYQTAEPGKLGGVVRTGKGPQAMILIPGLGFGGDIFADFMAEFDEDHQMYAVTLAGFGGTTAPACPGEATSFGEQTWTNSALMAIETLMREEGIKNSVVVGHWLTGTQLALRLAARNPDNVKAVVILAGSARMTTADPSKAKYMETLEQRVAATDKIMAPRWFKTVTRETWDDNNFLPGDYSVHPVRGLRLWREAARPMLHVWVRYLCEFHAQYICAEIKGLTVPVLLLKPGLEGNYHDPGNDYMKGFADDSWNGCMENNPKLVVQTIQDARVCLWCDRPKEVAAAVSDFLRKVR